MPAPRTLHCLGTAGYHPSETRHTSCYFLPELGVVLDAGSGIFRLPPLIQTDHLDILLSHAHLDHVLGLTFLLGIRHARPVKSIRVWGEAAKLEAIRNHLLSDLIFPVDLDVQWRAIDDHSTLLLDTASVTWHRQPHPGGSVGYAIEPADPPAARFVYATDTTGQTDDESIEFLGRPDLLLHECNFRTNQSTWAEKTGHCYVDRVLEIADRCCPRQTVLTHLNPVDELTLDDLPNDRGDSVQLAADRAIYRW